MPLVLSGTLAFGTMGVPLSAYAIDVNDYDEMTEAEIFEAELAERVAFEDGFTQEMADELLAEYYQQVEEENALALAALEEEEKAKEKAAKEAAEAKAAEEAKAAAEAAKAKAAAEQDAAAKAAAQAEQDAEAAADAKAAAGKHAATAQGDAAADEAAPDAKAADDAAAASDDTRLFVTSDGDTVQGSATGQEGEQGAQSGDATTGTEPTDPAETPGETPGATDDQGDQGETAGKTYDAEKAADSIRGFLGAEAVGETGVADLSTALGQAGNLAAGESMDFTFSYVYQGTPSSRTFTATALEDGSIEIRDSLSGAVVTTVKATEAAKPATDDEADKQADQKASQGKHAKTFEQTLGVDVDKFQKEAVKFSEDLKKEADEGGMTGFGEGYPSVYAGSNAGYTRVKYTTNLTTGMFIASIGEQARQICQEKNLYASVMIAQAIVESDSGNSGLARDPYNNLFGIKGAYNGNSVTMATQEDNGSGGLYDINAAFRAYKTKSESLKDYADLLRSDMSHYYKAWKENAKTYKDAAKALQGTYATSTIYADTLCAVIEAYDLTRFDKPLDFKITGKDAEGHKLTMDDYAELEANAVSFLGTPYVWGGTTPDGFDCSGFVQYLYKQTFGIELPRTTYTQQYEGKEVSFKNLQMGDLLFFDEGGSTEHVAMYLGDGFYIHAPEPGDSIKITDMESFTPTFAKRIIKTEKVDDAKAGKKADKKSAEKAGKKADAADAADDNKQADAAECRKGRGGCRENRSSCRERGHHDRGGPRGRYRVVSA